MENKIGFIGSGNMTEAFINGLVNKFPDINNNIFISDSTNEKSEKLRNQFSVNTCSCNKELVNQCNIIILAVKPNAYEEVLCEIRDLIIMEKHIIVSIAAGITINYMQEFLEKPAKIIRTMPNTPILVGEGMTAVAYNQDILKHEVQFVLELFESLGKVEIIDEKLMDVATAIGGSSPAFVFMFIEALADGAVLQGMSREQAYRFSAQAVLGGAKLLLENRKHPGELKDIVCTPGGTTIEAIYTLEKGRFRATIMEAMNSCVEKAKSLVYKL